MCWLAYLCTGVKVILQVQTTLKMVNDAERSRYFVFPFFCEILHTYHLSLTETPPSRLDKYSTVLVCQAPHFQSMGASTGHRAKTLCPSAVFCTYL